MIRNSNRVSRRGCKDIFDAPAVAAKIRTLAGTGFTIKDWTQENAPLFSALQLEKFTYFLVLMLIVLVAAFNIIATLVMVVMERRKEIAILRAMGARAGSVAAIFLTEGAVLGVVGTVLGTGAGFVDLMGGRQVASNKVARRYVHHQLCSGAHLSAQFRHGARSRRFCCAWWRRCIRRSRRARSRRSR